jgi:hypothetical protein
MTEQTPGELEAMKFALALQRTHTPYEEFDKFPIPEQVEFMAKVGLDVEGIVAALRYYAAWDAAHADALQAYVRLRRNPH